MAVTGHSGGQWLSDGKDVLELALSGGPRSVQPCWRLCNRVGLPGVEWSRDNRVVMFRNLVAGVMLLMVAVGCTQSGPDRVQDGPAAFSDEATGVAGDDTVNVTAAEEVIVKRSGAPSTGDFVWAAWTDSDEGLAELWGDFGQVAGTEPDRDDWPVVLIATHESGSCPLTIATSRLSASCWCSTLPRTPWLAPALPTSGW